MSHPPPHTPSPRTGPATPGPPGTHCPGWWQLSDTPPWSVAPPPTLAGQCDQAAGGARRRTGTGTQSSNSESLKEEQLK